MSWDADLKDDRGHVEGMWNYTHNTNAMLNSAWNEIVPEADAFVGSVASECFFTGRYRPTWWKHLDGMSGADGARFLSGLVTELRRTPDVYRAMNPENGWGDYDGLLEVLDSMIRSVPEWPTNWTVNG